jgi:IclR family pca regulon transcriptional regulator
MGKAILAHLNQDQLQAIIDEISRDPSLATKIGRNGKILKQQLAAVREQGYALSDSEFVPGLASIAAPIRNANGSAEGAINVPVFAELCSQKTLIELHLPLLLETAKIVSQLRGYEEGKTRKRRNLSPA